MKARQYINMMGMAAAVLLSSCVKDTLYDTPHPDYGKIAVTADWSARGEGVDIPASWHIVMGDYTGTETSATHTPDHLFAPGSYTLAVYNPANDITVSGATAAVVQEAGNGAYISNTPGWLFTSVQEVEIEADTDYSLTAVMQQQVRELTLMIEPAGDAADRIESIGGTLSGAAGTGKWMATVRLLGIAGDAQRLTATLTYTDGNPQPTSLNSDLTSALNGFNDGKTAPLTLGGTIAETPGEAGFTGEITDWETVDGGGVKCKSKKNHKKYRNDEDKIIHLRSTGTRAFRLHQR